MSGSERIPFAVYAITRHGLGIAARLASELKGADVYVSEKLLATGEAPCALANAIALPLPMRPALAKTFAAYDCHVFILSLGAVVRMIAPLLRGKKTDAAVICIDDACRFAICVLSGHVGRGNAFAQQLSQLLGAKAVITTASDAIGTLRVDILGRELGWTLDDMDRNVTRGCAALVNGAPAMFVQETGEPHWWPLDAPLPPGLSYATSLDRVDPSAFEILLVATDREIAHTHPAHFLKSVVYRPRSLALGIGCDKGAAPAMVERGTALLMTRHGLSLKSVRVLATIDHKRSEPAIVSLARRFACPLQTYSAQQLDAVQGIENPSDMVKRTVGTRGVAEPAALLAAGASKLVLGKQAYSEPGANRSMTLAVARLPFAKRCSEASDG